MAKVSKVSLEVPSLEEGMAQGLGLLGLGFRVQVGGRVLHPE
jgi:hypothetical protein